MPSDECKRALRELVFSRLPIVRLPQVGRLKAMIVPEPVRALQEIEAMGAAVASEQAAVHVRCLRGVAWRGV